MLDKNVNYQGNLADGNRRPIVALLRGADLGGVNLEMSGTYLKVLRVAALTQDLAEVPSVMLPTYPRSVVIVCVVMRHVQVK